MQPAGTGADLSRVRRLHPLILCRGRSTPSGPAWLRCDPCRGSSRWLSGSGCGAVGGACGGREFAVVSQAEGASGREEGSIEGGGLCSRGWRGHGAKPPRAVCRECASAGMRRGSPRRRCWEGSSVRGGREGRVASADATPPVTALTGGGGRTSGASALADGQLFHGLPAR